MKSGLTLWEALPAQTVMAVGAGGGGAGGSEMLHVTAAASELGPRFASPLGAL
jgi:hypothetical protein